MRYLVDTHVLVWWQTDSPELGKSYQEILDRAEKENKKIAVSIITLWEIAKLAQKGRLELAISLDAWLEQLELDSLLEVVPLNSQIILESMRLGSGFHQDPADQLIVATARTLNLRLLTKDKRIVSSGAVIVV